MFCLLILSVVIINSLQNIKQVIHNVII